MSVDYIICGDLHLDASVPECRTDDFQKEQWRIIEWISDLQEEHEALCVFPGDIFNKAKSPQWLERKAIIELPPFIGTAGQHDLPHHNINNLYDSSLGVLISDNVEDDRVVLCPDRPSFLDTYLAKEPVWFQGFWWGADVTHREQPPQEASTKIAIMHKLTWTNKRPWPGCEADNASKLATKMKDFDIVICGDNHDSFKVDTKHNQLVNCGSLMRRAADQMKHEPCVWLLDAETLEMKQEFIPVPKAGKVITRKHLEKKQEKETRREAYVEHLKHIVRPGLCFRRNLEQALEKAEPPVEELVRESLGDGS